MLNVNDEGVFYVATDLNFKSVMALQNVTPAVSLGAALAPWYGFAAVGLLVSSVFELRA